MAEFDKKFLVVDDDPVSGMILQRILSEQVATFHPGDYNGVDYAVDALLKRADAALYWVKEEVRNRVALFEGGRDEGADS